MNFRFLFNLAHVASIWHLPYLPSELILFQYLTPSCLLSEKASSCRGLRVQHFTVLERLRTPTCQREVEGMNWKISFLSPQPNHGVISTQNYGAVMQPPKKGINILQLPIIDCLINLRPQLPPSQTLTTQASLEEAIAKRPHHSKANPYTTYLSRISLHSLSEPKDFFYL